MNKLLQELSDDPLGRNYAAMTNQQIVESLNNPDRTITRDILSSAEIYENIDISEFQAKQTAAKEYVRDVLGLGDNIKVGPGSKARTVLLNVFGASSNTITSLSAALQITVSRAQELGLGEVREGDVQVIRGN